MASNEKISSPQNKEATIEIPDKLDLVVVNLDKVLFEGQTESIIAPGPWGNFAILPGHTPLFIKLDKGKLIINNSSEPTELEIEGGIAKINQTKVVILVGF